MASTYGTVKFWGIGNEPFIAWKRSDYPPLYSDAAHGDQVLNADTSYDHYFNQFTTLARTIKLADGDTDPMIQVTPNATGFWEGYDSFKFDIKTDTMGSDQTALLLILSDESGNKGKPAFDNENGIKTVTMTMTEGTNEDINGTATLKNYTDILMIEDGPWQTLQIPLDGRFFDWCYPEGQNGAETVMDFSAITQIEFVPWNGEENRKGVIYIDNLRLVGPDSTNNRLPVAMGHFLEPGF